MVFEPNTCLKKASNSSGYFCGFRVNVILTEGVAPVKVSFMCIAISATKKKTFYWTQFSLELLLLLSRHSLLNYFKNIIFQ
jgi:hypothetical protein